MIIIKIKNSCSSYVLRFGSVIRQLSLMAILLVVSSFQPLNAQNFQITHYTFVDGLADKNIYDCIQRQNGEMYFASRSGIFSYDGTTFSVPAVKDSFIAGSYSRIIEDEKQILWVLPQSNNAPIQYYDGNYWKSLPEDSGVCDDAYLSSIAVAYSGGKPAVYIVSLWQGIFKYEAGSWELIVRTDGDKGKFIKDIYFDQDTLYYSGSHGLGWYAGGNTGNIELTGRPDEKSVVKAMYLDTISIKHAFYLLGDNWIGKWEDNAFSLIAHDIALQQNSTLANLHITTDNRGGIFYGNEFSYYYYDIETGESRILQKSNGLITDGVTATAVDREGIIWAASLRGVNKMRKVPFENFYSGNGLLRDEVSALMELPDGTIAIGHNNGLSFMKNEKVVKTIQFEKPDSVSPLMNRVLDMKLDSAGNLWIAAALKGIGKVLPNYSIQWFRDDSLKGNIYTSILFDTSNTLIIATNRATLRFSGGTFTLDDRFPEDIKPRKLFLMKNGAIAAATYRSGFFIYDNGNIATYKAAVKNGNSAYAFFESEDGMMLVGTFDGLYYVDGDSLRKYDKPDLATDEAVFFLNGKNREYWVGGIGGLIHSINGISVEYNVSDGLAGEETNRAAGIYDRADNFWIGTNEGLSIFKRNFALNNITKPLVEIKYIEDASGGLYDTDENLDFSSGQNNLTFHFRCYSYLDEQRNMFYSELYDERRGETIRLSLHDPRASFTNLLPGSYRLMMYAENAEGIRSDTVYTNIFTIEKPLFERMWFILSLILATAVLIFFFVRFVIVLRYKHLLENEVANRTKELKLSEERYRLMIDNAGDAIFITDGAAGTILKLNQRAEVLLGLNMEEILLMNHKDIFPKQLLELITRAIVTNQWERQSITIPHTIINRKTDTYTIVEITANFYLMRGRQTIHAIVRDITARKQAELAIKKYNEELQELNAGKDKFFSIMAHDLRNPFHAVLGFSDYIVNHVEKLSKEDIKQYTTHIRQSTKSSLALLDNLLLWSRLQTGKMAYTPRNVELESIIDSVVNLLKSSAYKKNISLINEISINVTVFADAHMIETVIRNLLSNAIKFTPRGGSVEIHAEKDEADKVRITIRDDGVGMEEEQVNKLFSIESHSTTLGTENESGSGLGIILCQEFLEKHGTHLEVESRLNEGTTFRFTLTTAKMSDG